MIATKFGYIQNENMRLLSEGVFQVTKSRLFFAVVIKRVMEGGGPDFSRPIGIQFLLLLAFPFVEQRVPPEEIVEYSRECYHSIHPEFMRYFIRHPLSLDC